MSKDLNKVMVIGRLGKDPEMRFTPQGSAVTNFTVAAGRQWKDTNGEQKEDTEWFSVVAWNKLGEICNQYLVKGTRVYIEGRLQTRYWDDQQSGEKKYRTEVIAEDMIILDNRNSDNAPQQQEQPQARQQPAPQRQQGQAAPTSAARVQGLRNAGSGRQQPQYTEYTNGPVDDEDIPF